MSNTVAAIVALYVFIGFIFLMVYRGKLSKAAHGTQAALAQMGVAVWTRAATLITGALVVVFWPAAAWGAIEARIKWK